MARLSRLTIGFCIYIVLSGIAKEVNIAVARRGIKIGLLGKAALDLT